eukprot:10002622-Alexandrium_andersonii.AAC.1
MKQAKAQWDIWAADPEAAPHMSENKNGVLMFRIHTGTAVNYKNRLSHIKSTQLQGKADKKPTE